MKKKQKLMLGVALVIFLICGVLVYGKVSVKNNSTNEQVNAIDEISSDNNVGKKSKISLLVFQSPWQPVGTSTEYLKEEWWDKYSVSQYPCFYEENAVELLDGNAKTDWILENDSFTEKKYEDSDDVEGLMASYYETTYTGKEELNCSLVVSPFTRWWAPIVKIYVDEQYYTTIEYPDEVELMSTYVWDICNIVDGNLEVKNTVENVVEVEDVDEDVVNEKQGHMNGVLMVINYGDCDKMHFSTVDDDLYLMEGEDGYSIPNNHLVSGNLDLYKNNIQIAVVSVVDYDCSTIEKLNESYIIEGESYEVASKKIEECNYSYLKSKDGQILPMVRGQLYIGSLRLYPVIQFNEPVESEKELYDTLEGLKWSYEWSLK